MNLGKGSVGEIISEEKGKGVGQSILFFFGGQRSVNQSSYEVLDPPPKDSRTEILDKYS